MVGVMALDSGGRRGSLSNLVSVYVQSPPTTTQATTPPGPTTQPTTTPPVTFSSTTFWAVVGSLAGLQVSFPPNFLVRVYLHLLLLSPALLQALLLLACCLLLLCWWRRKRRRTESRTALYLGEERRVEEGEEGKGSVRRGWEEEEGRLAISQYEHPPDLVPHGIGSRWAK